MHSSAVNLWKVKEANMYDVKDSCKLHRNYNCRIREVLYNGVKQVNLDNELLHIGVLAGKGSDIFEFVYKPKDLDFMWHSFQGVKNPKDYVVTKESSHGKFLDLYEGGWQELFPNYGIDSNYMNSELGIHGEVCVASWEYEIVTDTEQEVCVKFSIRTPRTPYYLEKWLTLKAGIPTLYIRERVTNEGAVPLQFMWGHHPALGAPFLDEYCEIQLNGNCHVHTLAETELAKGMSEQWPKVKDRNGMELDLSRIRSPKIKKYLEYGISDIEDGQFVVWNHKLKVGFGMKWDKEVFPYLWIWEPNGASPGYPWYGRNYTLGIEPWSHLALGLDEVVAQNKGISLLPGESKETSLTASVHLTPAYG